jgi:D-alanyl-D-alanine carboxypeptidase/D-alanyl-D-alanine-endopeptidase (penicillin-binding protein 4)
MPHPALAMAQDFPRYLRRNGFTVTGEPSVDFTMPKKYKQVCVDTSFNLLTITALTTQTNSNIAAESLFKLMGYLRDGHGCYASGRKFLYDYFNELNLDPREVKMVDGSGLSPIDRVTTDFLCRYLAALSREPFFENFYNTLAVAGESGTAKNIKISVPGVSVHMKTGTIGGVKAYAGYVDAANGDRLAFAVISNGHSCKGSVAGEKLTSILQKIASIY